MREENQTSELEVVVDNLRHDLAILKTRLAIFTTRQSEHARVILDLRSKNERLTQQISSLNAQLERAQNDLRIAQDNAVNENAANELVSTQAKEIEKLKKRISELEM